MSVIRFILMMMYPWRYYFLGPAVVCLFVGINTSFRPYIIKLIVNTVANPTATTQELWTLVQYLIILQFLQPLSWRIYDYCSLKYEPSMRNYILQTAFRRVTTHDYNFFQDNFAGNLAAKISDVIVVIPNMISVFFHSYYMNIVAIACAIFVLWQVHVWFAIAILVWSMFLIIISVLTISRFGYLATNVAEVFSKIIGNVVDCLSNILNIRLFSMLRQELVHLEVVQDQYLIAANTRRWILFKFYTVQGMSFFVYMTACLLILVHLHEQGQITAGDFAMIMAINATIIDNLWNMSEDMRIFSENWGSVAQALKILYSPNKIQDLPDAKEFKVTSGEVMFDHVTFGYKDGLKPLFYYQSLKIDAGSKVGLVGYSGGGKSSFINLILRLYDVTDGRILIDGQNIREVTQDSLRANIGMIPQDPALFHRSLMDNIRYGRVGASDEEVIKAAQKAHAHEFIIKLPQGYDSLVGERGIKLSGGQRQRIAIARTILKDAPILILDEATSQLDSVTESDIQESLWELMQNKTTIVIAHRLSTLLHMDRILVFEQGQIVEDGTHQELLARGGLYKTLWDAQIGGFLPEKRKDD